MRRKATGESRFTTCVLARLFTVAAMAPVLDEWTEHLPSPTSAHVSPLVHFFAPSAPFALAAREGVWHPCPRLTCAYARCAQVGLRGCADKTGLRKGSLAHGDGVDGDEDVS